MSTGKPLKTLLDFGLNMAVDKSPSDKAGKPEKAKKDKTEKAPKQPKSKDKEKASNTSNGDDPFKVFESLDTITEGGKKRLSIERIYQKKTQLEHILLRPSTYIGSVDPHTENAWVYDQETERMVYRSVTYVPGLYKIFDEIVVNAADNKQRDPSQSLIKININVEKNEISVWNNGKGIPVVEHQVEKVYVPELIFGTLLTSSNYDDTENRLTGGLNGFGAKLCNIFSKKFTVETSSKEYKKSFKQTWLNNMGSTDKPHLSASAADDFTCVTFSPDLAKFGMEKLDDDIVALMSRRAYDVAGSARGVKVYLNGKKLPITGFKQYVELYTKTRVDENNEPLKLVYEQINARWEIAVTVSEGSFQQISFVNSIATMKGGRHTDYVADQIVDKLIENVKRQIKKTGMNIRPSQIKNHVWLFVNCLIVNPTFDSQTKENMTLPAKSFGSKCELPDKFVQQAAKSGIVESVMNWLKGKAQQQLDKQCHATKHSKLKGISKLDDANNAGTKNSYQCTLILTEGDSAKSLAVSGLGVVGRDNFGVFPLRGKVLNVREATHKQIMENAEINYLIKILGLQYKKTYNSPEDMKTLRYGKVMIMADQDQDGSHIKGLVVNFIHHNWPSLIRQNFLEEFITPIVKVTKGKQEISFYSIPEYEEWKSATENWNKWKIKYYKGLGTSTSKEAKEYFSNMLRHRIKFSYRGMEDDNALELAFSKKKIEERKEWLTQWMVERKERRQQDLPDIYLYGKDTRSVTFQDFINKELVLFSNMDNERSIPSLVDGLKPGQRKVMFTCFKRNDKREVKVAQLAGSVAEMSAYHHGEQSLMATIINLAQNYIGSNNINLLLPIGQFGTRLQAGKDAASPRYIFTMLSPVTRTLFPQVDDACLKYLTDDNKKIEPEWYCPILPTVLINGAEGIGTGWSTKVPLYNPRDLVDNVKRMMNNDDPLPMKPWLKNYLGTIEQLGPQRFLAIGEVSIIDDQTIEITELPYDVSTQGYKESVLEPMLNGTEKNPPCIQDYREYHTDTTVRFVVKLLPEKLDKFQEDGLHKVFKLQSAINLSSMVLFDAEGCLRRFESADDILKEFYEVRLKFYDKRKSYLDNMLEAEAKKLSNQARYILETIEETLVIKKKKRREMVDILIKHKYDPDPIKRWQDQIKKTEGNDEIEAEAEADTESSDENAVTGEDDPRLADFLYLLNMKFLNLSEEDVAKLLRQRDEKLHELNVLRGKTPKDLWQEDLATFLTTLDKHEAKEKEEELESLAHSSTAATGKKGKVAKGKPARVQETMPTPKGKRVIPNIDSATREKYMKVDKQKEKVALGLVKKRVPAKEKKEELENSPLSARVNKRISDENDAQGIKRFLFKKSNGDDSESATDNSAKNQTKRKKKEGDDDDDDAESIADIIVETRDKRPRAAAAKSFKIGDGSDEDDEDGSVFDFNKDDSDIQSFNEDSDSDFEVKSKKTKPKATKPKAPAAAKAKETATAAKSSPMKKQPATKAKPNKENIVASSNEDDDDFVAASTSKPAAKKPAGAKSAGGTKRGADTNGDTTQPKKAKAAPKPKQKKVVSDSDEDSIVFGSDTEVQPAKTDRPARAGKKPATYTFGESDSEEEC